MSNDQISAECAPTAVRRFRIGDRVRKQRGTWWEGRVVGFYGTDQTPIGYCVQLDMVDNGAVQIYPEDALEHCSWAPQQRAGFVVVPIDPTDRMVDAALGVDWECDGDERAAAINIWHAMQGAA